MDPLFIGEQIAETTEAVGHLVNIMSASSGCEKATKIKPRYYPGPLTVSYGHMFCAAYVSSIVQSYPWTMLLRRAVAVTKKFSFRPALMGPDQRKVLPFCR